MTSPIISFQDFGFQYDAQAEPTLHHINLDVYPGQKILIAGASGSGKSTVASCINGLIPHAYPGKITGKVLVDGKDVTQSSVFDLSHTVGTVLQDTDGQFIGLTVAEDIAFALENDCVPQDDMKKTVQRVAQLVDIEHHLDHAPYELSGGQKQRVSLAGVMVDDVKVLLFDEPLANLDPAAGRATIELIDEIQEKTGAAVLIIEHRLEDVLWRHVDRVVLMQDGAIVADLPPGELLCGNFLMERGIREPLYLTALRYALVPVTPEICPEHPDTLKLTDAQKQQVKNWVLEQQEEVIEQQPGTELLKVEHLSFSYGEGRKNLEDISFTIYPGEMVSIVGKNGAGKSTLSAVLTGRERFEVTQGEVEFNGKNLLEMPAEDRAREGIFLSFQYPVEIPGVSMVNFMRAAINAKRKYWGEEPLSATDFLKMMREKRAIVELDNKLASRSVNEGFSGGEKKRNEIFQMAMLEPRLSILDETDSGLDIDALRIVAEGVNKLKTPETSTIVITHYQRLLDYIKPDIVHVLYKGRIVKTAGPELALELEEKGYDWIKKEVGE